MGDHGIAVADNPALDGPVRPWPVPHLLADSLALDRALPGNARGAIVAYGERDEIGKVGAGLALIVRGPAGVTFVGRLDHTYGKPLKASITLAKVF